MSPRSKPASARASTARRRSEQRSASTSPSSRSPAAGSSGCCSSCASATGIRLPDGINVYLFGWLVDAVWHHAKLVVEIDETSGHKTPAQIRQDRRREFDLRAKGYIVLRYTEEQLMTMPEAIAAEIASYL